MTAADLLREAGAELTASLDRARPADALAVSAAVETGIRIKGRFAGSRITEVSRTVLRGAGLRYLTADAFHHVAGTAPGAGLVELLYAGGQGLSSQPGGTQLPVLDGSSVSMREVLALLSGIDAAARSVDDAVTQVVIAFEVADRLFCVGGFVDRRPLVYLTIRAIVGAGKAAGVYTPGLTGVPGQLDAAEIGAEAGRRAVVALHARPAPVGRFPVVVRGGRGIVLLHEACCHALEADEVMRGSVYAGKLGERVASPLVTIVDDPTVTGSAGSYLIDDEGLPAAPTTLVEDGVVRSYLTDSTSARRLGEPRTPNGRCASALEPPLPRMSTTCLLPGEASPQSIIGDTGYGIYAENVGGGEVIESTGEFVFRVTNGYLIENGRITDPIADTTIAGQGEQVLRTIDAVGDDWALGAAKCGKFGQYVPVGVAGPTVRVPSLLVGGTGE